MPETEGILETHFATPVRSSGKEILDQVEKITMSPIMSGVLEVAYSYLAILNENRQFVAVNERLFERLGYEKVADVLGMRPGEALGCAYADDMPAGCGTSKHCASCGAAIALVSCLVQDHAIERTCALKVDQQDKTSDLFFSVRAQPIKFRGERFILLFMQDISRQQQWAMMERIFFHDINNIMTGLVGASELLLEYETTKNEKLIRNINHLSSRLSQEIKLQQALSRMDTRLYQAVFREVLSTDIIKELERIFHHHKAAEGRSIDFDHSEICIYFHNDECVLIRVLANMITNALEATERGGTVRVWVEENPENVTFYVWNHQYIDTDVANRLFQRNFSTKGELGRGLGTYSMKMFGETILGGEVGFNTSEQQGTTFFLKLPV